MRSIYLSLDQRFANSLLCRLQYDSPPCSSSSSLRFFLKVFQAYIYIYRERERERERGEREKEQYKQRTERKNKREPIQYKKERNIVEKK